MAKNKKRRQARKRLGFILLGLAIILLAGWWLNRDAKINPDLTKIKAAPTNQVILQDFSFNPATIRVKEGSTVTWTNQDSSQHTVTADSITKFGPNGPTLNQDDSYSFKFTHTGIFSYHCSFHPEMRGAVIVVK